LDEQLAMKAWLGAAVTLENTKTRMSIVKRMKKFGCGYVITSVSMFAVPQLTLCSVIFVLSVVHG
jgi:hypothetical protein